MGSFFVPPECSPFSRAMENSLPRRHARSIMLSWWWKSGKFLTNKQVQWDRELIEHKCEKCAHTAQQHYRMSFFAATIWYPYTSSFATRPDTPTETTTVGTAVKTGHRKMPSLKYGTISIFTSFLLPAVFLRPKLMHTHARTLASSHAFHAL